MANDPRHQERGDGAIVAVAAVGRGPPPQLPRRPIPQRQLRSNTRLQTITTKLKAIAARRSDPVLSWLLKFKDTCVVCSILVEAGMVNLEQDDATILLELKEALKRNCKARMTREGRIGYLELGKTTANMRHLSENISELRSLKQLTLIRCAGLLTNLPPNLRKMSLHACDKRLVRNLCAPNVGIGQHIEYFFCGGTSNNTRISGSSINNLIHNVAKFRRLKFLFLGRVADPDQTLQSLQQNGPVLGNKLTGIGIIDSKLSEDHLATLMFEILKTYDHMKSLRVEGNQIVSLRNIADRLESEPLLPSYSRGISRLYLDRNPVLDKIKNNDPDETLALSKILSRFQRIHQIQALTSPVSCCGPRIEYALRINHAGRILVEGNNNNMLPLSVWPIVLARSYNNSPPKAVPAATTTEAAATPGTENNNKTKEPTGLFYLIRHGPIIDAIASQRRETPENENKKRKLASSLSSSLSKRPTRRSRRLR